MLWVAAQVLGAGGWTWVDVILFVCFAFGTPWTVLGFWNALIGLWLLHFRKDAMAEVAPYAAAGDEPTPIAHQDRHLHDPAQRGPRPRHPAPEDGQGQRRRHRRGRARSAISC